MNLAFRKIRFCFTAKGRVHFPAGKAANVVRGAFGLLLERVSDDAYKRVFSPHAQGGPSGMADQPRPFVFRAAHLDGLTVQPGAEFEFAMNLFELDPSLVDSIRLAFAMLEWTGLGPGRSPVSLTAVRDEIVTLDLVPPAPGSQPLSRLRIEFVTPTELKAKGEVIDKPEFGPLFARLRDRIANLYLRQHGTAMPLDFRGLGDRATEIRMTNCQVRIAEVERRSSRTGQEHSIGGFVGYADYEGNLTEFLPFLAAGAHTGVGRQTVWGKGEIRVTSSASENAPC